MTNCKLCGHPHQNKKRCLALDADVLGYCACSCEEFKE